MNPLIHKEIDKEVFKYKRMREELFSNVKNTEKYREINTQATMVETLLNNCTSNISPKHANLIKANRDFTDFCYAIYDIVNRNEVGWQKAKSDLKTKFDILQDAFNQIDWK